MPVSALNFSAALYANSLKDLYFEENDLIEFPILPKLLRNTNLGEMNVNKIEYDPDYKNIIEFNYGTKIKIDDHIITNKKEYIAYMEEYENYLLSKIKSARK